MTPGDTWICWRWSSNVQYALSTLLWLLWNSKRHMRVSSRTFQLYMRDRIAVLVATAQMQMIEDVRGNVMRVMDDRECSRNVRIRVGVLKDVEHVGKKRDWLFSQMFSLVTCVSRWSCHEDVNRSWLCLLIDCVLHCMFTLILLNQRRRCLGP